VAARSRRDYYAVLGVPHGADRDTIRRAFRTLAAEWHPDVSVDPEAVERFREIAEAYEVLSRPDARERYDRYGFDPRGVGGFSSGVGSPAGMFDDLLDLAAAFKRSGRGADVAVDVEVGSEHAAGGGPRGVRYAALTVGPTCHGEGGAPGSNRVACADCAGRGRRRNGSGGSARLEVCEACRGTGRVHAEACGRCDGVGRFEAERAVLIEIPSGSLEGDEVRVAGEGHAGGRNAEPGDLVVTVHLGPDPARRRLGLLVGAGVACVVVVVVLIVVLLSLD
jgi:molecular chaperone DnaJ